MVGEESVQLQGLSEILSDLDAANLTEPLEIAVVVDHGACEPVPLQSLKLKVGGVFLELKVSDGFVEVDVGPLDRVHVLTGHLELIEVVVLRKDLHLIL